MSRPSTASLISQLARDLQPVRRVPPLRKVGLGLLAVWGVGVALSWSVGGVQPRLTEPGGLSDPTFAAIFAGLCIAGVGGGVATLARAVPGRERLARLGLGLLFGGFAVVAGFAVFGWLAGGAGASVPPARTASCAAHAAVLGVTPALLGFAWLARAWEARPGFGAAVAGLGAAALGSCAVHASCITGDGLHVLVGHALGPAGVAVVLASGGAWWIARRTAAA